MRCGDPTIDGLLSGEAAIQPLRSGAKGLAVGYLQDLLRGHGYVFLPDPRSPAYGVFGLSTCHAVTDYRRKHGLPAGDSADSSVLGDIVARVAAKAVIGPAYVPLVLDRQFSAVTRLIWLTSLFEANGQLGKLNLNTDRCGVSFGVLQWAQKPGRLHELLEAFCTRQPAEWARIMGQTSIVRHTAKPNGGLDGRGYSVDPNFELTKDPWKTRLEALGASMAMQRVQIDLASEVYTGELRRVRGYAQEIQSERGLAFMLDLANQFGAGRVEQQYKLAVTQGESEPGILKKLEDIFTNIALPQFRPQVRARREFFRTTTLLSDSAFARQ
jgi:hypothetical protein